MKPWDWLLLVLDTALWWVYERLAGPARKPKPVEEPHLAAIRRARESVKQEPWPPSALDRLARDVLADDVRLHAWIIQPGPAQVSELERIWRAS